VRATQKFAMQEYLNLVKTILQEGERREDRTGTGTISMFGVQARYDLREGFPLLTENCSGSCGAQPISTMT
jgi:thymidylate synthase